MKRKIVLMSVICCMAISLCACGAKEEPAQEEVTGQTKQAEETADEAETVEEQTKEAEEEDAKEANQDEAAFETAKIRHKYADVLSQLNFASTLPDMEDIEPWYDFDYDVSENKFAVCDVDQDGREELIISYTTASMAGMFEIIYAYNPDTDELTQKLLYSPGMEYYDNGMIKAPSSHNQTPSDFWPITVMQYNADSNSYEQVAYIDAWDKSFSDTYYGDGEFPNDLDKDGDGILYNIQMVGDDYYGADNYKYDQADLDAWMEQYFKGANQMEIPFQALSYESYGVYVKEYFDALKVYNADKIPSVTTDISELFYDEDLSVEEVKQQLVQKYGIEVAPESEDFPESEIGTYNGKDVLNFYQMDGGTVTYRNEKVEDLTVFGMYPGMDLEQAKGYLEAYGFYPMENMEEAYITGIGMDNKIVYLSVENGKIVSISTGWFCMFVG